jgi:3-methylfumaryl-CoA hydratase
VSVIDIEYLRQWIGRSESRSETLTAAATTLLTATLDIERGEFGDGEALPLLFHWLYFPAICRQSNIGSDGHPTLGGFLPPIPLPRRMWAASGVTFRRPLFVGDRVTRTTRIADISLKEGRSGALVFIRLHHEIAGGDSNIAVEETQDLVYRGEAKQGQQTGAPAPTDAGWVREVTPDPVLLFRYSALTFNSHRIHYDRPYATNVEGYPALVVHAPLVATLLLEHLRRNMPDALVKRFEFRALRPLFDETPFSLCGRPNAGAKTVALWSRDASGALCTDAHATID